jgi:hypothetical protein
MMASTAPRFIDHLSIFMLWVGDDRTEEAVKPFFTREMGARRLPYAARHLYGHVGGPVHERHHSLGTRTLSWPLC